MAKGKRGKGKGGKKPAAAPHIELKFTNPEKTRMAKGKGKGKTKKNPKHKGHSGAKCGWKCAAHKGKKPHHNPGHKGKGGKGKNKRRRNPEEGKAGLMTRVGHLLGAAAVALGSATLTTVIQAKVMPGNPFSLYGAPALVFLGGAALASKYPTIGTGIALGGVVGPFALPIAARVLGGTAASKPLAGFDYDELGAVELGDEFYEALSAVENMGTVHDYREQLSAVELGAVELGDEGDEYDDPENMDTLAYDEGYDEEAA